MEVDILLQVPEEWKKKQGKTYETKYLYTGFSRYDVERHMYSRIQHKDGKFWYSEIPSSDECFPKCYHVEHVRVTVYSESPRVWKEELSATDVYFFVGKQQVD